MVRNRQSLGLALRLAALASVSVAALPAAAAGPVQPLYGNIQPFYGNIQPFYGNIQPFYGNLQPFYGDIKPFWGDMKPFWGDIGAFSGDLNSFWGTSNPVVGKFAPDYLSVGNFWTATGSTWDQISAAWGAPSANYSAVAGQLKGLVDSSRTFWGAAVAAKSGGTFDTTFANPLLAKYGIDLNDPNSLSKLDATKRAMFFLDWYDGLMNYSGTDHVDHWMKTIDWTPAISLPGRRQGHHRRHPRHDCGGRRDPAAEHRAGQRHLDLHQRPWRGGGEPDLRRARRPGRHGDRAQRHGRGLQPLR